MSEIKNDKPLWLDLRTEYIDDNFDRLLSYLKENSQKTDEQDSFYSTTVSLLEERVKNLMEQISAKTETEDGKYYIRLLASYLLVDSTSDTAYGAFFALFKVLLQTSKEKWFDGIIELVNQRLRHTGCENLGYTWSDIEKFQHEVFLQKVIDYMRFSHEVETDAYYTHHGTAVITKEGLQLVAGDIKLLTDGAASLDTQIGSRIITSRDDKIKQQDSEDLDKIEKFVTDFVAELRAINITEKKKKLLNYASGDEVIAKVTRIDGTTIHLETVDPKYKKEVGVLSTKHPNIFYYDFPLFSKGLQEGDFIKTTIKINATGHAKFYITDQFTRFCVEDCRDHVSYDDVVAQLYKKNPTTMVWISVDGIPIYSRINESFNIGDYAVLQINNYCDGDRYGIIESEIIDDEIADEDKFDRNVVMHNCIKDFAKSTPPVSFKQEATGTQSFNPLILRMLESIFFIYQQSLTRPIEKTTLLGNARIIAELLGDQEQASFYKFSSEYLRMLVKFASGEDIKDIALQPDASFADSDLITTRLKVLDILKEYGKKENSDVLADCIEEYETSNPMLSRLARLVQTSNTLDGILSNSALSIIKREIIHTLSIETENNAEIETETSKYMGVESSTTEFKTSMVFPPDNDMQPNIERQTENVFKAVCAFLNSKIGGTVYLGVNDMGYVCGLQNDLDYLKCKTIDSYTREYIQDKLIKTFGLDVATYIQITPMFENDVVAIKVDPHPYRIVNLNGVAYIRVNNESRVMTESVKKDILLSKMPREKETAAKISVLQFAMSEKKCVTLKNYSSSSSGSITDRKVEPYKVLSAEDLAFCFDYTDKKSKVFRISRIGYVEKTEEPWKYTSQHNNGIQVDIFHMTGESPIKISWQMDLLAKNLLTEEYPSSKQAITPDSNDENVWYFNTTVYDLHGVARFYVGLVDHIKILDAPELKAYIDEYKKKI